MPSRILRHLRARLTVRGSYTNVELHDWRQWTGVARRAASKESGVM